MKLPGEKLRDKIASLLRIKYQTVTIEAPLTATTADVLFIDDTNPKFHRPIAIEAKDWSKRLSSKDLATIYNLYEPSLRKREIDHLWIVGRETLSAGPRATLESMSYVEYSTFEEFCSSLMNFHPLLSNNALLFEHEEASHNFVQTRVRNSLTPLFEYVTTWLTNEKSGLIVYGGYGLGKTTFSYYLASTLSKEYQAGNFDRIPIRISLGGMYSKQDLMALICSALSGGDGGAAVKDFSFGYFLEMNSEGQYLLILDGFDEMRHAMDLDDFVFTFEDMRPLFSGNAKVILLGRPDSFLTNSEEDAVLSSLFDARSDIHHKLEKVEVSFFSKPEIVSYLNNFLEKRGQPLTPAQEKNYKQILDQVSEDEESLLERPVQLKMFTKIIDECLDSDESLNRYQLYRKFIYGFINRESRKPARKLPPPPLREDRRASDARADFMQAVAWWLLNDKKENRFLAEDIPLEIVPPSLRAGRTTATAIREAIVGSVIEPINQSGVLGNKAKRFYYFPHKSYLEFLVANYFESSRFTMGVYREFMRNINNEILTFIEEGPADGITHLRQGLMHNLGQINPRIIEVCATDRNIKGEIDDSERFNRHPSQIYTHYAYLRAFPQRVEGYLLARLTDSTRLDPFLATVSCIAMELKASGNQSLARSFIANCISSIPVQNIRRYVETKESQDIYRDDIESFRGAVIATSIFGTKSKNGFSIDLDALSILVNSASRRSFYVQLPSRSSNTSIQIQAESIAQVVGQELKSYILKLAELAATNRSILPAQIFGSAQERFLG